MEDKVLSGSVFLLHHPLADPRDPPVCIPTRPRSIPTRGGATATTEIPPTPTSLSQSFSPPGSPVLSAFHGPSSLSSSSASTIGGSSGGGLTVMASCSAISASSARQSTSLARELTTRLWQREAELQTMKERYDAKIQKLKSMLQEAGVSPTEVENSLAEAETTAAVPTASSSPPPLLPPPPPLLLGQEYIARQEQQHHRHNRNNHSNQHQPTDYPPKGDDELNSPSAPLPVTSSGIIVPRTQAQSQQPQGMDDCDPLSFSRETLVASSKGVCEDSLSIENNSDEEEDEEDGSNDEDDLEQALSEAMSSCADSIISARLVYKANDAGAGNCNVSCIVSSVHQQQQQQADTVATRNTVGVATSDVAKGGNATLLKSASDTASCVRTEKGDSSPGSRSTTAYPAPTPPPSTTDVASSSASANNNFNVHTKANDLPLSVAQQPTVTTNAITAATTSTVPATPTGSIGIKTLREKWASGAFFQWSKSTSGTQQQHGSQQGGYGHHHHYHQSTFDSLSPNNTSANIFVRTQGIVDEKPAMVETSDTSSSSSDLLSTSTSTATSSSTTRDSSLGTTLSSSASTSSSSSSVSSSSTTRKRSLPRVIPHPTRPMSEIHYGSSPLPLFSTPLNHPMPQRDSQSPRQTLARIHESLNSATSPPSSARSNSNNPSPLHFRAISMAASLIGTGAITPARLYAKRTHTLIAKWTLGLLMNSRERNQNSGFPIIREAACPEQPTQQQEAVSQRTSIDSTGSNNKDRWQMGFDLNEEGDVVNSLLSPKTLSPRIKSSSGGGTIVPISIGSSMYHSSTHTLVQPMSVHSVVEMSDISSPTRSLSPSSSFSGFSGSVGGSGGESSRPTTDRYGFYTNARPVAVQQGLLKLTEAYTIEELDTPRTLPDGSERDTFDFMKPATEPSKFSSPAGLEGYQTSVISAIIKSSTSGDVLCGGMTAATASGAASTSLTYSITSPVLLSTTAARPTSTLSSPAAPTTMVTAILSQLKDLHDSVQLSQKEKWDAFLRKRRRKIHQGELHGNLSTSNLGSPLFGSLGLALEEEPTEVDDDWLYWSSQQIVGLATMGKGADWEEFRDLVRGGIPVVYRNKIWLEASGAWDMRQPGYYQELLSNLRPEQSSCCSDIEMDLHRTFPTNILFGYGGQGIDKLRNILTAYAVYNPTVGYCQGMNLLAGTLLLTNHSEEDAFWILTCLLGGRLLLPEDYFTKQLLAPQADQRVLRDLVQEILPRLSSHLEEMHVDLTAITFSWFLTLFTDCLPVETLVRVWDVLFVEGMLAVFRIAVALLWLNEKEILKCRNGATIYCYMKQMTLGMHQADKLLKTAMVTLKSSIQSDKVETKRLRYNKQIQQEQIREELQLQESVARRRASKSPPPQLPSTISPSTANDSFHISSSSNDSTATSNSTATDATTAISSSTTLDNESEPTGSPRATSSPRYIPRARSPFLPQSPPPLRAP